MKQEKRTIDDRLHRIIAEINMPEDGDKENSKTKFSKEEEIETIHVYIYREEPKQNTIVVDANIPKKSILPALIAAFIVGIIYFLAFFFQIFVLLHPPIATITLTPMQKELSVKTGILAAPRPTSNEILSYALKPVTFSQSKTSPATGRGHQNAAFAQGTITFYNGSSISQTVPVDTQLTGRSGVTVVTDDAVIIPPATSSTPPSFGSVSVNAHAIFTGPGGNIEAEDINSYSLGPSILAQNIYAFHGGMDARDFRYVTSSDISNVLNPLKMQVSQTVQTKLLSEVSVGQSLIPPFCSIKIFSDHKIKDEATQVKVTVSQTCKALTYDTASLQAKGSQILMNLAQNTLGIHFFPIYGIKTSVVHGAIRGVFPIGAIITVSIHGTWFYQFSKSEIIFLKAAIAGKPINTALHLVLTMPEVKEVRIQFQGFGNSYYLPKDQKYIRVAVLYRLA